jgi:hypothetical protein
LSAEKVIIEHLSEAHIESLLRFDPLASAEDITGTFTSDPDSPAMKLGFGLAMLHGDAKRKALLATGDTTLCNTLEYYQSVIGNAGFELCLEEPFVRTKPALLYAAEPMEDRYFIYARRDGFLLAFDTYRDVDVNGGKLWYNWRPNDVEERWRYNATSSGCFQNYDDPEKRVWVGDHDCLEALLHNINKLKTFGTILPKWAHRHNALWLLNGMDYQQDEDGERERIDAFSKRAAEITDRRLAQCPDWVREMVNP